MADIDEGASPQDQRKKKRHPAWAFWRGWIWYNRASGGYGWLGWLLNLGRFRSTCKAVKDPDTSWERPFLMIGVRSQDAGVNLGQALANAMSGKTNLPSTDCYSRYELAKLH